MTKSCNHDWVVIDGCADEFCSNCSTLKGKDDITRPSHYHKGGIDVIAYMEMKFPKEQLIGFHRGNVLKYIMRYKDKGGVNDLIKAQDYLSMLIEVEKNHG